ncbi:hypothetical protein H114_13541 [Streptomyces gancidicus BKS 13-15]|uniref:Uncharacterized protein n=2 Tax=Streptomyces pseudogriseolus TaxID=36817 RepID=M3CWR5_STREZ|nr:hypothetical protein H114_13541 [Streptomyces gancidicus BKS 13-15]
MPHVVGGEGASPQPLCLVQADEDDVRLVRQSPEDRCGDVGGPQGGSYGVPSGVSRQMPVSAAAIQWPGRPATGATAPSAYAP